MNAKSAIKSIQKRGALLVFPIKNQKEPPSLWSEFHPRTRMRWEWDDAGDNRVAELWHLREQLSCSKKVVYTKWYRGRATFFSFEVYTALLCLFSDRGSLSPGAQELLALLEEESPLSTKQLKKRAKLVGRLFEGSYQKYLKELWKHFLIVGFGEVDDGAFPSLALGAAQWMFEDQWNESQQLSKREATRFIEIGLADNPSFLKEVQRQLKQYSDKKIPQKRRGIIRAEDLFLQVK